MCTDLPVRTQAAIDIYRDRPTPSPLRSTAQLTKLATEPPSTPALRLRKRPALGEHLPVKGAPSEGETPPCAAVFHAAGRHASFSES